MATIKLHEVTRQLDIPNKLAMYYLEQQETPVKSHSSAVSIEQLELLKELKNNKDKLKKVVKEFEGAKKKKKAVKKPAVEKKKPPEKKDDVSPQAPAESKPVEKKPSPPPQKPEPKPKPKPEPPSPPSPSEKKPLPKAPPPSPAPSPPKETVPPPRPQPKPAAPRPQEVSEAKPPVRPRPRPQPSQRDRRRSGRPMPRRKKDFPSKPSTAKRKISTDIPNLIRIPAYLTLREVTERLNLRLKDLEDKLSLYDMNLRNKILDEDEVKRICDEFNVQVKTIPYEDYIFEQSIRENNARQVSKAPVVTVMGHVDHGKTTILDRYRNSRVAEKEQGGITQRIGAYKLSSKHGDVVFIDTPGHEAFTSMRARGASTTDIVVLVIAAEDGVMPQTIEAINHARAAGVPLIVAINKIDLPTANVDGVKQGLAEHDVLVEDWGGDVVSVEISAKNNTNLDALLEMISLVSEMQELKRYDQVLSRGRIIESRLDQKTGATATVLVEHGTLRRGDCFICGNSTGKVKMMFDDNRKSLPEAPAVIPVEVVGFNEIPRPGELFQVVKDIAKAQRIVELRNTREVRGRSEERFEEKKMTLQNLFSKENKEEANVFSTLIKADNSGSVEVLKNILKKQEQKDRLEINILHTGIGNITESDVMLAATSNSMILGFNVRADKKVLSLAKREAVNIQMYNVIYHLVEDIQKALKGEIKPEYKKERVGKVEVLKTFSISRLGTIAGCIVREGRVTNKSQLRVMRGDDFLFEGELETLKRMKDEVREIKAGTECGIKVRNFNDLQPGDVFEVYEMVEKK